MALQKQIVTLSNNGSLDTKTDEFQVAPSDFLELQNVRVDVLGAFQKRNGYTSQADTDLYGAGIGNIKNVMAFGDLPVVYNGSNLYSYAATSNKWIKHNAYVNTAHNSNVVLTEKTYVQTSNACKIGNYTAVCGYDFGFRTNYGEGSVYKSFFIIRDGEKEIFREVTFYSLDSYVVSYGTSFYFIQKMSSIPSGSSVSFIVRKFDTSLVGTTSISSIMSTSSITVSDASAAEMDIQSYYQDSNIVYCANNAKLWSFNLSTLTASSVVTTTGWSANVQSSALTKEGTNIRLVRARTSSASPDSTPIIQTALYTTSFSVVNSPATVYSESSDTEYFSRIFVTSISNTASEIYFNKTECSTVIEVTGNIFTATKLRMSMAKVVSPVILYNSNHYFLAAFNEQNSTLVHNSVNTYRSVFLVKRGTGSADINTAQTIAQLGQSETHFYSESYVSNINLSQYGGVFTLSKISKSQISQYSTFSPTQVNCDYISVESQINSSESLSGYLNFSGGVPSLFDGKSVYEIGFLVTPFVTNVSTTLGGDIPAGTYFYKVLYSYTDSYGNKHYSQVSAAKQAVIVSGTHSIALNVPYNFFTNREGARIEIYRTTASGTIFYKLDTDVFSSNFNNRINAAGYLLVDDVTLDSDLINGEILYTQSGVLDSSGPYPSTYIHSHKNRLFSVFKNGTGLQFSNESVVGEPPTWAEEFIIDCSSVGGSITGLGSLESGLIIFKESAIYILSGNGPNALGENSDYGVPVLITTEAGCIDGTSIVEVPAGLIFKSSKGFYLLGRNLQVQDIGKGVEKWRPYSVTCSSIVPDKNEVRFGISEGFLVYEYQLNKWTLDTGLSPISCAAIGSDFYYVDNAVAAYKVRKEIKGQFNDDGSQIPMLIKTAWISLAGLQSSERLYKLLILAHFKNRHRLNIAVLYDFSDSEGNSLQYDTNDVFNTPDLNDTKKYEFKFYPKRQKCTSFQLIITDGTSSGGPIGENLVISNIAAEVGIKSGLNKLPVRKSGGGS